MSHSRYPSSRRPAWHRHPRATTIAAALVVGTLATTALAAPDNGRLARRVSALRGRQFKVMPASSRFAVLARASARASANGLDSIPPGAVHAATVGQHEMFVLQRSGPAAPGAPNRGAEVCLIEQEETAAGGMACAALATAEQEGVDLLTIETGATLTDAVLVPNGVSSVEATDSNGTSRTIPVSNNVAVIEDSALASVHYAVPGGVDKTTSIAEVDSGL